MASDKDKAKKEEREKTENRDTPDPGVDKAKLDKLKKEQDKRGGIPYENEHVSSDPNRTPHGDDRNENVSHHHEDYVEPYNKKKFHNDKKSRKPPGTNK